MASNDTSYGIIVCELQDVVPRRVDSLPNLYVGITSMDLERRFRLLDRGRGPRWLKGNLVGLRQDLSSPPKGMSMTDAKEMKVRIINELMAMGYTVNRNSDVWTVYVIELDPSGTKDPGTGYVYVGETKKDPTIRFAEHMGRVRNSRTRLYSSVVAKYGVKLRMDLAPGVTYLDSQSSKVAEAEWAAYLRTQGYEVRGGH